MGVVRITLAYSLLNFGVSIISLEWVKIGILKFCVLIDAGEYT